MSAEPTRVLTAVDGSDAAKAAVELVGRLRFAPPVEQTLVNVVEPQMMAGAVCLPLGRASIARVMAEREKLGRKALQEAEAIALKHDGLRTTTLLRIGDPAEVIASLLEESRTDLVVVGSADGAFWDHVVNGSVQRDLLHMAPCSILFGRPSPLPSRPLRAVFATDHSDYARLATDLLIRLAPKGFEHVTIVTAYPRSLPGALSQGLGTQEADELTAWLEERLRAANLDVSKSLTPLGATFSHVVSPKPPVIAVRDALDEYEADVLIVGARGRRRLERLTVGSVSQQLVQHTTRHVLLLRLEHFTGAKGRHHGA